MHHITEFIWRRAQSTARRAARPGRPNDGLDRELAGSGRKFWDLVGSDGIWWDRAALPGMGPAESTPWTSLRPGAQGGISRDSRAEFPAISKDFRPAKPSRELEVITHHTPFAPGTMFLSRRTS